MKKFKYVIASLLLCGFLATQANAGLTVRADGVTETFDLISETDWDETAVRKVLHTFAYAGFASDGQIKTWADMPPLRAIEEMLTFDVVNPRLSAVEDATAGHCGQLAALQDFWSSDAADNPQRYDERHLYHILNSREVLSIPNLQNVWIQALNVRGCNPVLHKMAFYLTNYHAAISAHKIRSGLMRDYYDSIAAALSRGESLTEVLRIAASSAAVSRGYGHLQSVYLNRREEFRGNDDFAREFFQLLFRIQGETEDPDYHENVSIEHNAWLLTGMGVDAEEFAYGSINQADWLVAPINFTDHIDGVGRSILNVSRHYHSQDGANSCLEILHTSICGETAEEKLRQLAPVAAAHPESMANIPVTIVDFYADDNLSETKKAAIRILWHWVNDDVLSFVRWYAVSTAFHHPHTYKYRTAFDRNLTMLNNIVLSNEETYARRAYESARLPMLIQGAEVFEPAHDVFGGQTGLQAANNRYLFKDAFSINVSAPNYVGRVRQSYPVDENPDHDVLWNKNWGAVIPTNSQGEHIAGEVADWLWGRFMADGGKNFDVLAKAQITALLAEGVDFGYAVDPNNPEAVYYSADLTKPPLDQITASHAQTKLDLSSLRGNQRVGLALNFITMMPYTFALEGN